VASSWNQWVLGYTPDRQRWLLSNVGLTNATWEKLTAALFVLGGAIVAVLTFLALRQIRGSAHDPAKAAYQRFCDKLRRKGLPRDPAEGPGDYARRVEAARPELTPAVSAITQLYVALRYGGNTGSAALENLQRQVRQFAP
jgi:protein-glutamine gamma-glutamyltransferase